jgi:hypothetical protein
MGKKGYPHVLYARGIAGWVEETTHLKLWLPCSEKYNQQRFLII